MEDSDRERACQAVSAALERLYLPQAGVVKLFDPPFQDRGPGPRLYQGLSARRAGERGTVHPWGCVAGSGLPPPGPDGGWAGAAAGPPAGAPPDADLSGGAYVLAADVYAAPGHLGRGGWSWYTGAAGWYYRTAVEELLGLKVREGRLFVEPHLPEDWPGWTGEWELDRGRLSIQVSRGESSPSGWTAREIPGRRPPPGTDRGPPAGSDSGTREWKALLFRERCGMITLFCFQEGNSLLKGHRKRGTPPFVQRKESDL